MKKLLLSLLLLATVSLKAQQGIYAAYDHETLTVANSSTSFTASKVTGSDPTKSADLVTFTVNCATGTSCVLRMLSDGTAPTTSTGLRIVYGQTVTIYGHDTIANFRGIRETSTSVLLDIQYFRTIKN